MKRAVLGTLMGAGLVLVAAGAVGYPQGNATPQRAPYTEAAGDGGLIALSGPSAENAQLVTVLDTKTRAMAVYRVDAVSGKIKLLSVRNLHWDLQVLQLNSETPLPQEIRSLLDQR
jgi:hypothetical protein